MVIKKKRKKIKKEKVIEEKIEVEKTDVGDVLPIIADKDNPIGDGLEYKDGDKNE